MGCGASQVEESQRTTPRAPAVVRKPLRGAARQWKSYADEMGLHSPAFRLQPEQDGSTSPNSVDVTVRSLQRFPVLTDHHRVMSSDGSESSSFPSDGAEQETNPPSSALATATAGVTDDLPEPQHLPPFALDQLSPDERPLVQPQHDAIEGGESSSAEFDELLDHHHPASLPFTEDSDMAFSMAHVPSFVSCEMASQGAASGTTVPLEGILRKTSTITSARPLPLPRSHGLKPVFRKDSDSSLASMHQTEKARETTSVVTTRNNHGNKIVNNYVVLHELGRGQQGKVKLAQDSTSGRLVAIKIIDRLLQKRRSNMRSVEDVQRLASEVDVMKRLHHRNVVNLFEVIDDAAARKLYVVMQFVDRGPIFRIDDDGNAPQHNEKAVRDTFRQVVRGLLYLHRRGILHRDVKPDNMLMDSHGQVYLTDFGVAGLLDHRTGLGPSVMEGTPAFHSPEMLEGRGGEFGTESDTWALGVSMFTMLYGTLPFKGERAVLVASIRDAELPFPPSATPEQRHLFQHLLHKSPEHRMTLMELRRSPWLRDGHEEDEFSSPSGSCLSFSPQSTQSFSPVSTLHGSPISQHKHPLPRVASAGSNFSKRFSCDASSPGSPTGNGGNFTFETGSVVPVVESIYGSPHGSLFDAHYVPTSSPPLVVDPSEGVCIDDVDEPTSPTPMAPIPSAGDGFHLG